MKPKLQYEKMHRPNLDNNFNSKTFRNFYYLKEELIDFCRVYVIPTSGRQIEITREQLWLKQLLAGSTRSSFQDIIAMKRLI